MVMGGSVRSSVVCRGIGAGDFGQIREVARAKGTTHGKANEINPTNTHSPTRFARGDIDIDEFMASRQVLMHPDATATEHPRGRFMAELARRSFLLGSVPAGAGVLADCSGSGAATGVPVQPSSNAVRRAEQARRTPGGRQVVTARLTPRPVQVDLGGRIFSTWGYDQNLPGPLIRARAGDLLRVEVDNQLPAETSVHWQNLDIGDDSEHTV